MIVEGREWEENRMRANNQSWVRGAGIFDPQFNPDIAGSHALSVFPQLGGRGIPE